MIDCEGVEIKVGDHIAISKGSAHIYRAVVTRMTAKQLHYVLVRQHWKTAVFYLGHYNSHTSPERVLVVPKIELSPNE